jgi:hypothetical protein
MSGEAQADLPPRHEPNHPLDHGHASAANPNVLPSHQLKHSAAYSGHGHHGHQRIGPGIYLDRQPHDQDPDERRQLLKEREIEREREREREVMLRQRLAREEEEIRALAQTDAAATHGAGRSRSDTPGSGESYERDAPPRMHAPRVTSLLNEPEDYYDRREDRVSGPGARGYASGEYRGGPEPSRKRSRHDMEVDDERASELRSPVGAADSYSVSQELRGPRRGEPDDGDVTRLHTSSIRDEKPMDQDD